MQLKQRAAFRDAFGRVEAVHVGGCDVGVLRPSGHNHRGAQSDTARQKTHPSVPSCFCWGSIQRLLRNAKRSESRTNVRVPKIRLFSFSNLQNAARTFVRVSQNRSIILEQLSQRRGRRWKERE